MRFIKSCYKMLFVLNIGNTKTQYGVYTKNQVTDVNVCETGSLNPGFIPAHMPIAAACVVPDVKKKLESYQIFWLGADKKTGLNLEMIDAATLGADRLANGIALSEFISSSKQTSAVCIDCGTAITFEVIVDRNIFWGGAIAPGRQLLRNSLNDYTALLPKVKLFDSIRDVSGVNTEDAIHLGVDKGIIGAVKEILDTIRQRLDSQLSSIIITGGDATFFLENIPGAVAGGNDFTLKGVAAAWKYNQ